MTVLPSPTTCTGSVVINVPGGTPNPLNIPVILNIGPAQTNSLSVSPTSLSFSYAKGQAAPASQTLTVTSTGGEVSFTAGATTTSGGNWLSVSPTSGATPGTVSVSVNAGGLATGPYSGTVTVNSTGSPVTIPVTLTVTPPAPPTINSLVNAATLKPGAVSPGEIITIFGTNIGPATPAGLTLTTAGTVSTALSNTQVFFDTVAAPLIYVSATQINAIVPYEINGRATTNVTIQLNSTTSNGIALRVVAQAPGIFTSNASGFGQAAALNRNGTYNGTAHPALPGSVISIVRRRGRSSSSSSWGYRIGDSRRSSIPEAGGRCRSLIPDREPRRDDQRRTGHDQVRR